MNYKFSIIIPTFQRFSILKKTIRYFQNQQFCPKEYELIVIFDGRSDLKDSEKQFFSKFSRKLNIQTFFSPKQKGQAFCRNIGIYNSYGKYLLFIDDDTLPGKKLLIEHLRLLETDTNVSSLGVVKTISSKKTIKDPFTFLSENSLSQLFVPSGIDLKPEDVYTGNLAIKKIKDIYFNDTVFNAYGYEDVYFGKELIDKGCRIIKNNSAMVYHMKQHKRSTFIKRRIELGKSHEKWDCGSLKKIKRNKMFEDPDCGKLFNNDLKRLIYYKKVKDYNFSC